MTKTITKGVMDAATLCNVARDILQEAKRCGADQAEVNVSANKGYSVSVHDGEVETVEYHQDKAIEIDVYFGKRIGSSSISDIRPEAIRAAVEAACHIAKFTDEDPAAGLADESELAMKYPELSLCTPWSLSVPDAIKLAIECEREALAQDTRLMSAEEVAVGTGEALHVYATSNGFLGFYPFSRHEISCVLIAKQDDEMQRDYYYTVASDPKKLMSAQDVAHRAAERTLRRLGARQVRTTKAPVIFMAEEARSLLGHFSGAISGGALYRKASFLLDHLDKPIFPAFVHLQEFPHLDDGLGSAPFDDDGVATRSNVFVEGGVLRSYATSVYSARKLGITTTGNAGGMHNLTIRPGTNDFAALLKKMDTGLVITELMGNGVNILTGDYSRGVGGYWVEKGEIQYPVQEVTVASTLQEMYKHIVDVGTDVDLRGNIRTGSILLEEMMIAGS